jgi:hypothetical protein
MQAVRRAATPARPRPTEGSPPGVAEAARRERLFFGPGHQVNEMPFRIDLDL